MHVDRQGEGWHRPRESWSLPSPEQVSPKGRVWVVSDWKGKRVRNKVNSGDEATGVSRT